MNLFSLLLLCICTVVLGKQVAMITASNAVSNNHNHNHNHNHNNNQGTVAPSAILHNMNTTPSPLVASPIQDVTSVEESLDETTPLSISDLEKLVMSFKPALEESNRLIASLQKKVKSLTESQAESKRLISSLVKEVESHGELYAECNLRISSLQKEVKSLAESHAECNLLISSLVEEVESHKEVHAESSLLISSLQKEVKSLAATSDSKVSASEKLSTAFQWLLAVYLGITTAIILEVFRKDWIKHDRPSRSSAFMVLYGLGGFLCFTSYQSMAHSWTYLGLLAGGVYVLYKQWIFWRKTMKPQAAWVNRFKCKWDSKVLSTDGDQHCYLPSAVAMTVYLDHMKHVPIKPFPKFLTSCRFRVAATVSESESESNSRGAADMSKQEAVKWMKNFAKNNWNIISTSLDHDEPAHQDAV